MIQKHSRSVFNPVYYPYIDGLRALAVLAVFFFHLDSAWVSGGFVGVDVFFVLSGFIVSASIASFRGYGFLAFLGYFYARRIKRIFPVLIVCLLVTGYVSALFVPASWLSGVNQETGLYAFFGLSNLLLAQTGRNYFAPTAEFNPYTHTWSLAVEEQFYLIFPLLFLAWLGGRRGRLLSVGLFGIGLLASVVFSAWQSQASPIQAYFLSPGRFWELAAGVLLYQLISLRPAVKAFGSAGLERVRARELVGFVSLLVLLASFFFSTQEDFPMPGALMAVLGTLGIIFSLHSHPELERIHGIIGSRPLVLVGRISYSLYLWHWPVFVFFRWTCGLDTLLLKILAASLAFLLAIASYRFVERPIRHSSVIQKVPQVAVIASGLLIIGGSWWLSVQISSSMEKLSLSTVSHDQAIWYPHGEATSPGYPGCTVYPQATNVGGGMLLTFAPQDCHETRPLNPASIYVIGDSHALAYEGMFKQYAIHNSIKINAYNNGGCPFLSLQPIRDLDNPDCQRYAEAALYDIRKQIKSGDVLFLASLRLPRFSDQWAYFGDEIVNTMMFGPHAVAERKRAEIDAVKILSEFAEKGVQVVLEAPKPLFKAPPFRCADWFNRGNPICSHGFNMPREQLEALRKPVLDSYANIARQVPGVKVWDPFPILCSSMQCQAWEGGFPLFMDGDHLSGYGNKKLLPSFAEFMHDLVGVYPAKLEDGFDLSKDGMPDFLSRVEGISHKESWGRWSDASLSDQVQFEFVESLPESFELEVRAQAYGPNIGKPVLFVVGGLGKEVIFSEKQSVVYLSYENINRSKAIQIVPPVPTSPQSLGAGGDSRKLGIGISYIKVHGAKSDGLPDRSLEAGHSTENSGS
ncbi:Peptidoglycan/LPS O-acetylase OafA/YrhL, contains acyltransferase and SGNH-hydrolase domains [Azotobacter beijerinckii]|uniref:Peptidoglycan/LPS O-acetylase OafA/YrhL, contains acyltransferase and SGNH-hydrolase domains n=1 Tax=Azotobacter beijerinckii TaxID=170623 RepID=A0A1H9GR50_9GAMM|nr:acyltransferase family protein [Azotobacter beijerinckii]SEQ52530.1 Peptidoglycan/LPS O-acetylase OafA/YrhL, contains acyltransferase and SGNH-hydrolase domains [Azotobacter beijerinckii]